MFIYKSLLFLIFNAYFLRLLFKKGREKGHKRHKHLIAIHAQFTIICPNLPSKANHMSDTATIYCVDTCLCRVFRFFVVPLSLNDD